jgi:tetratricopeptide (TPR) repeat protein
LIDRLLKIYRSPLFGFGVVMPALIVAFFWWQRDYLHPAYWSRAGLAMVWGYTTVDITKGRDGPSDWGHETIPPPNQNILSIASLLRDRDFAGLGALAKRAPDDFHAFADTSPDLSQFLDGWVAAEPDSADARMLRGHYWFLTGRNRRGDRFASSTSATQFREMRSAFDRAESDYLAALDRDRMASPAYARLLSIYSTSRRNEAAQNVIWERAVAEGAATTALHRALFIALMPRWSRLSPADSKEQVSKVVDDIENGTLQGTGDPELLRAFPDFIEAEGLWRSGMREEALKAYAIFIDRPPGRFYLDDYAARLRQAGRTYEALRYSAASLRFDPSVVGVWEGYAHSLSQAHHYRKAEAVLAQALSLDPYDPDALILRGDFNVYRGRLREALIDFERAQVHGSERPGVSERLHWVRSRLGD